MLHRFADSYEQDQDPDPACSCQQFHSKNKFEKLLHLFGFFMIRNKRCLLVILNLWSCIAETAFKVDIKLVPAGRFKPEYLNLGPSLWPTYTNILYFRIFFWTTENVFCSCFPGNIIRGENSKTYLVKSRKFSTT